MMLDQFDKEIATVDMTYAKSKNLTVTDVVIIASILERETNLSKEYPLVASVIYNRLRAKKRLQLDSTVFYTLPEGTKILTKDDLARVTPYNTYRRERAARRPYLQPGPRGHRRRCQSRRDGLPLLRADEQGRVADVHNQLRRPPQGRREVPESIRHQVAASAVEPVLSIR